MAAALISYQESSVTCGLKAAKESEDMRITLRKTEVRYAGGDADTKCPAYCWGPSVKGHGASM